MLKVFAVFNLKIKLVNTISQIQERFYVDAQNDKKATSNLLDTKTTIKYILTLTQKKN